MPIKSYAKEAVTARTGVPVDELLRGLYVDRRWTHQEIADHLGISRQLVVDWCQEYGISRADRTATFEELAG